NESTRPLILSENYFQKKHKLLVIESLKLDGAELHDYRYVMKPTLPVHHDSPNNAITLVLAVLLGGMIGAGVVLGRNALRGYNAKAE
ncbi:LPS O-antigen chain length determinant protein WzzB, partial [Citrobacter freundii]